MLFIWQDCNFERAIEKHISEKWGRHAELKIDQPKVLGTIGKVIQWAEKRRAGI